MTLEEKIKQSIRDVQDYPKPGIMFKDITPVLADPTLVNEIIDKMVQQLNGESVQAIAAVEARGFILGSLLASRLNCAFLPVRKSGKLPFKTISQEYDLEYGKAAVEIHQDAISPGSKVVVHDDLLATGGTADAAARLIKQLGGEVVGFSFLINLSFLPGAGKLEKQYGLEPKFLVSY